MIHAAEGVGRRLALALVFAAGPAVAQVTVPTAGQDVRTGDTITVRWEPVAGCTTVDIDVYQGRDYVDTVGDDVTNSGTFEWSVGDLGIGPACNLTLRVGCGAASSTSARFGVDGLLLTEAIEGDREVTLRWNRVPADTLGALLLDPQMPGERAFGGYSVWRSTFDNQLSESLRGLRKIRGYDVQLLDEPDSPRSWDFSIGTVRTGAVEIPPEDPDDDPITRTFILAQTVDVPAGESVVVERVRIFTGQVLPRWDTTLRIVRAPGGLPDLADELAAVTSTYGGTGTSPARAAWRSYEFTPPVTLPAGQSVAIVFDGEVTFGGGDNFLSWASAEYDALDGGERLWSTDGGATWEVPNDPFDPTSSSVDGDFAYTIAARVNGGATEFWRRQRIGGPSFREFNDPASIRVLVPGDEQGDAEDGPNYEELDALGPYNGFELRYGVTAFDRFVTSSTNVEFPSACEDTVFVNGFPDRTAPSTVSVWPEELFPRTNLSAGRAGLLADVYPVPNPYIRDVASASFPRWERPDERRIEFVNLPEGATLKIYTLAGDLVRTLSHSAPHGVTAWNLRNDNDKIVVSGVYLWLAEIPSGERKTGQLVIVR